MGAPKLNQGWIVDPWLLRHHTVGLSLAQLPPETEPYGSQPRRAMVDGGWVVDGWVLSSGPALLVHGLAWLLSLHTIQHLPVN